MHSQYWRLEISAYSASEFANNEFTSSRQNSAANSKVGVWAVRRIPSLEMSEASAKDMNHPVTFALKS